MSGVLFSGCSYTKGVGLRDLDKDPAHYANKLMTTVDKFKGLPMKNIAVAGNSNQKLFYETLYELTSTGNHYDYIFVGWTSSPRYWFDFGFELYETTRMLSPSNMTPPVKGHQIEWSKTKLEQFRNDLMLASHPQSHIVDIIRWTNILINLAKMLNSRIFFINAMCAWDDKFFEFNPKEDIKPSDLTVYTNYLLDSDTRDDEEIRALYKKMHQQYADVGGIHPDYWLNLYESIKTLQIDYGDNHRHPGYNSHQLYADIFSQKLNNILN